MLFESSFWNFPRRVYEVHWHIAFWFASRPAVTRTRSHWFHLDSYGRQSDQWRRRKVRRQTECYLTLSRLNFSTDSPMYDFIDSCLRHKNEMVIYEAASTIVSLKCVTPKELSSAVNVLQLFISSPKPVLRYAAVRTLNKVRWNAVCLIERRRSVILQGCYSISSCRHCLQCRSGNADYGFESVHCNIGDHDTSQG